MRSIEAQRETISQHAQCKLPTRKPAYKPSSASMTDPRPATYNKYVGNSKNIEERAMVPVISDHQAANDLNLYCENYPPRNPNS